MPTYIYKVRDDTGKLVTGAMDGMNPNAVALLLQKQKYFIIAIDEKAEAFNIDKFLQKLSKVKLNDIVTLNIQLANMISSGISLPSALSTLTEQIENPNLRDAVKEVYADLKGGMSFADSLKKHPDIFSPLFINMIHAGEVAGNLDEILTRLSQFAEHDAELRQKISTALFYPVILVTVGCLVIVMIIVTILPAFAKIFIDANVPLPLPTMVLYNTNLFIRAYWKYMIAGAVAFMIIFNWFKKTPQGKNLWDRTLLAMPIWGGLVRLSIIARFTRTFGSLLASGVPMLQALDVTEHTIDNSVISAVLKNVYSSVSKGESISTPLKESGEFPPMPVHMIAVGEETGALDTMLNKVADYYDMTTDYGVKKVTALIEPIALVIIGGMVGFIFASILLPIFSMIKTLKH